MSTSLPTPAFLYILNILLSPTLPTFPFFHNCHATPNGHGLPPPPPPNSECAPGQNLVLKIDWTRANFSTKRPKTGAAPGLHRAFFCLKEIRSNPRPGQNLVLKIDWTRAKFSTKQPKTGAKLNTQNRLDRPTEDQFAQNNLRPRQNKILRI